MLNDQLAANPARELIEARMLPTSVEDVGEDYTIYGAVNMGFVTSCSAARCSAARRSRSACCLFA